MRRIRPGFGLAPKYFKQIVGRTLACDVAEGQATAWELLDKQ
ncbi:hypothetical protein [Agarivorans sp.]